MPTAERIPESMIASNINRAVQDFNKQVEEDEKSGRRTLDLFTP